MVAAEDVRQWSFPCRMLLDSMLDEGEFAVEIPDEGHFVGEPEGTE
jgi:hypothetical protein